MKRFNWFLFFIPLFSIGVICVLSWLSADASIPKSRYSLVLWWPSSYLFGCGVLSLQREDQRLLRKWLVWVRYVVAEGTIVVLNRKVLYPGQCFYLWPFFKNEVKVIEEETQLCLRGVSVKCQGGESTLMLIFPLRLKLEEAKERDIASIRWWEFLCDVEREIRGRFSSIGEDKTLKELLDFLKKSVSLVVNGITIEVEGVTEISTRSLTVNGITINMGG